MSEGPFSVVFAVIDGSSVYEVVGPNGRFGALLDSVSLADIQARSMNQIWEAANGPSLQSRLAEAEGLLRELEWSRPVHAYGDCCPICEELEHSPDCRLAKFLNGGG